MTKVTVDGTALVDSARETADVLSAAFESPGSVEVDISSLRRADLSFVQLLVAASNTARERHMPFTVSGDLAPLIAASGGSRGIESVLGITTQP